MLIKPVSELIISDLRDYESLQLVKDKMQNVCV